jgi:diaminohydroxyphosphoribosylaminopyrimidine deaminase / 5-amino-6-(5-phosphoribosylamino)uracil reductase
VTSGIDRLFLERAYELAARGIGNTSPNPPVGAVLVRDGRIIGEGYHHRAGLAHAEIDAIAQARNAQGATLYISLEPCNHHGRTPPCTYALVEAGIARVVAGTLDPNPTTDGMGVAYLREHGIEVTVADDPRANRIIEPFTYAMSYDRPYLVLKMAMSLDGYVGSQPGVREPISSEDERLYVRELRIAHDAVMVGAGTIRIDDPQLTVRPPYHRLRPYVRVVACETDTVSEDSRIFENVEDYAQTIVLAPAGAHARFENLRDRAEVVFVGDERSTQLDLAAAMRALRAAGVQSVLCEGGPTLGARLLAAGVVDRCYWAIAPILLSNERAIPVLAGADLATLVRRVRFESCERVGEDVIISCLVD